MGPGTMVIENTSGTANFFAGNILVDQGTLTAADGSATNGAMLDTSGAGTFAWAAG